MIDFPKLTYSAKVCKLFGDVIKDMGKGVCNLTTIRALTALDQVRTALYVLRRTHPPQNLIPALSCSPHRFFHQAQTIRFAPSVDWVSDYRATSLLPKILRPERQLRGLFYTDVRDLYPPPIYVCSLGFPCFLRGYR
jgi:hypothetical protein